MKMVNAEEAKPEKSLFFGYGSLMYPEGINGRGMRHTYRSYKELIPITIKGLRRSMSARATYQSKYSGEIFNWRYYSVAPEKHSKVFGMLFEIKTMFDLTMLLLDEGAHVVYKHNPLYYLYDISAEVPSKIRNGRRVFTLIAKEIEDDPNEYAPGYVEKVYYGIAKKYRKSFLETGGISPNSLERKNVIGRLV